jgi:glycosyltransferase involved in cell wall biosynthesis
VAGEAARHLHADGPTRVITNGLDLEWFDALHEAVDVHRQYAIPKRRIMMVFTGRMERRKGIHLCAEIAASILERYDVSFVLAGDDLFGYMAGTLLPALAARPLKGSIHWLGPLGIAEVRSIVRAADIFLLPSLWENCPYSCLEAMAAGRAVVAADQGGMPELIESGVNGLLAAPGEAASFVRCIEQLIEDPALRERLGRAARETVERSHGHTHVAREAVGVYRELVDGKDARA